MFLKISLFMLMLALCILYLKQTETFYLICDKITKEEYNLSNISNLNTENLFLKDEIQNPKILEKYKKVLNLCKEFHTDYSTHKLMRYTLKILDDFVYNDDQDYIDEELVLDAEGIKSQIHKMNLNSFKFTLYATKFIHIFMYSIIIYISIVSIPNLVAKLALYFVNKALYVVFFVLLAEAFLKICFQVDSDIITLFFGEGSDDLSNIPYVKKLLESLAYPLKLMKAII